MPNTSDVNFSNHWVLCRMARVLVGIHLFYFEYNKVDLNLLFCLLLVNKNNQTINKILQNIDFYWKLKLETAEASTYLVTLIN